MHCMHAARIAGSVPLEHVAYNIGPFDNAAEVVFLALGEGMPKYVCLYCTLLSGL